jgi:hypothetical protein
MLLLLLLAAAVVLQHSSFDSNSADAEALLQCTISPWLMVQSTSQIRDCDFTRNTAFNALTAGGAGGAVFVWGQAWPPGGTGAARMVVSTSNFTDNMADTGGAIHVMMDATALNLGRVQLVGNVAKSGAGGLSVPDGASGVGWPVIFDWPVTSDWPETSVITAGYLACRQHVPLR